MPFMNSQSHSTLSYTDIQERTLLLCLEIRLGAEDPLLILTYTSCSLPVKLFDSGSLLALLVQSCFRLASGLGLLPRWKDQQSHSVQRINTEW